MGLLDTAREKGLLPPKGMIKTAQEKGLLPKGMQQTFDENRQNLQATRPLDPEKAAQWEQMMKSDRSNDES